MAGFLGMRGNGNWVTDQRPKNYREKVLQLWPNGAAPLTAMLSKMSSEKVDDPEFNWWTKVHDTQRSAITGVYTNAALSAAYASGGTTGQVLYLKMAAADIVRHRVGQQVLLRDASNMLVDVNAKVVAREENGASSYIGCKLLEADDNGVTTDLSDCDTCIIIGNVNSEGAAMPDALAFDPTKFYNYTQIFRTPLSITRTAMQTRLRTGDQLKEARRECLEYHSVDMEKAFMFGIPTESTGSNSKPERSTGGIIHFIRTNAPTNIFNYVTDSSYSGQAWTTGGANWLDACLEQLFRYGDTEKLIYCGSGTLLGIQRLAATLGTVNIEPMETDYGIKVTRWITPFGTVNFKTHPLFSQETTLRHAALVIEPKNLKYRFVQDTKFKADTNLNSGGQAAIDGINEEYLTAAGLEIHFPQTMGLLYGFNQTNTA